MPNSDSTILARRRFSSADQDAFARLSGDTNPNHMDPVAARRSVMGAVVVHGMHTVLWSLDVLAKSRFGPEGLDAIEVRFPRPAYLGDEVVLTVQGRTADGLTLLAAVGSREVACIHLRCGPAPMPESPELDTPPGPTPLVPGGEPENLAFGMLAGRSGQVDFAAPARDYTPVFPDAARLVGASRLRGLAACSRLVGMSCPGLRSVFWSLDLQWTEAGAASPLAYEVVAADPRFNLVRMRVSGAGLAGKVQAFSPPAPPMQLKVADLAEAVRPGEFSGQTALVIGGSRGLGELTAKAVAAGGGRVLITYAVGREDASRVAEEIRAFGSRADVLAYDVTRPASGQLAALEEAVPTHVYYFATCQIFRAKTHELEPDLLERFLTFYVYGFYNLCRGLRDRGVARAAVFYPSSVAVEERPGGLAEYAMAKAAGETLCVDIPRMLPGIQIFQSRLPRLLTDQTTGMVPEQLPRAIDAMLPILRSMHPAPHPD